VENVLILDERQHITSDLVRGVEDYGLLVDVVTDVDEFLARTVTSLPAAVVLVDADANRLAVAIESLRGVSDVPIVACAPAAGVCAVLLQLGADQCITLGVSADLLVAHLRASLRRASPPSSVTDAPPRLVFDDLVLDLAGRAVWRGDQPCELTTKEFDLLVYLVGRPGRVVTRRELMTEVWHEPFHVDDHTVDVHLSALRRKLGESGAQPRFLRTVRGAGVKFVAPEEPAEAAPVDLHHLTTRVGATPSEAGNRSRPRAAAP
jgi:two-component system, OmpR family, KDP operon response regulator KdpE